MYIFASGARSRNQGDPVENLCITRQTWIFIELQRAIMSEDQAILGHADVINDKLLHVCAYFSFV